MDGSPSGIRLEASPGMRRVHALRHLPEGIRLRFLPPRLAAVVEGARGGRTPSWNPLGDKVDAPRRFSLVNGSYAALALRRRRRGRARQHHGSRAGSTLEPSPQSGRSSPSRPGRHGARHQLRSSYGGTAGQWHRSPTVRQCSQRSAEQQAHSATLPPEPLPPASRLNSCQGWTGLPGTRRSPGGGNRRVSAGRRRRPSRG